MLLFHVTKLSFPPQFLLHSSCIDLIDSSASPKAKSAAATLKRRISGRQASKLVEQISVENSDGQTSDIQVASTAESSLRTRTPQRKARDRVVPSSAPPMFHDDDWRPQVTDAEEDQDPSILASHLDSEAEKIDRVLALRAQHDAESNKENIAEPQTDLHPFGEQRRLLDRQENATRVSFDTQESISNANASQSDIDEEAGFQEQTSPANVASRRSLKPSNKRTATEVARSQGFSPKRVRILESNKAHALNIAPERQLSGPPASQLEVYMAANVFAKERTAGQTKRPQVRRPWTEEETERLLYLISQYGTSWKQLKEQDLVMGNILESRDQVALKDKARNMKMDLLKYV